jgi:hypothetical protein
MELFSQLSRFRWILAAIVVFLISGCMTWGELIYLVSGRNAEADIVKINEVTRRGRFGIPRQSLVVNYSFAEADGTRRTGADTMSADWTAPSSGKVPVRYTPGANGNVRLVGNVNWLSIILFGVSVAIIGFFGFRLWSEATEASRERNPDDND